MAAADQGGVFSAAQRLELDQYVNGLINTRLATQFPAPAMAFLDTLSDPQQSAIEIIRKRLDVLIAQLEQAMPQIASQTQEATAAQQQLTENVEEAGRKNSELNDKAKVAFLEVEGRLLAVTTQINDQMATLQGQNYAVKAV